MSTVLNWVYECDRLNLYLAMSIHIALMMALLYPFRKRLARAVSPGQLVRLLNFVAFVLFYPFMWGMLDAREWYGFLGIHPKSLLHLSLPVRIPSQIAEVPSVGHSEWLFPCTLVWLAGGIIMSAALCWRDTRFRRRLKKRFRPCDAALRERMERILDELDPAYAEEIDLAVADGLTSPCVIPGNPSIIVLSRTDLSDEALDLILRHELVHILSNHQNMVERVDALRVLCWFNPALILLRRWCERQAELDADEKALRRKEGQRKTYARLLVELAEANPGMQGAALHLSAAAACIRERVDAVLNPRGHRCSVPVLILLVILFAHMTLLIAPGETPEARFPEKALTLACLGNPARTDTRGTDMFSDRSSIAFHENGNLATLSMEKNSGGAIRTLRSFLTPVNEEEEAVVQSYLADWHDSLTDLLGEPVAVQGQGTARETLFWPVTVTPLALERLNLTPDEPTLLYMRIITYDYNACEMTISLTQEAP